MSHSEGVALRADSKKHGEPTGRNEGGECLESGCCDQCCGKMMKDTPNVGMPRGTLRDLGSDPPGGDVGKAIGRSSCGLFRRLLGGSGAGGSEGFHRDTWMFVRDPVL